MDCCGIQPLPPVNAQAPPPDTLTKIPAGSLASQVVAYNDLLAFVNSQTNSAWFDLFSLLTSSSTYTSGKAALDALSTSSGYRILMINPEGKVFYDSSKGTNNTYTNSPNGFTTTVANGGTTALVPNTSGYINDNHNTRPDVISSLIFNPTGYGYSSYQSTSTGAYSAYVSKRIGNQGYANSFVAPGVTVRVVTAITSPF